MTETFIWPVETSSSGESNVSTYEVKFGDGYSQALPNGLNAESQKWTVVHTNFPTYVEEIVDFLRAHQGMSFYWTPPFGTEGYYRCKLWRPRSNGGGLWSLEMDFYEVFGP